jgi:hypothetical protein
MTDLQQIKQKGAELRLDFLLIGGLAVIEHGFARLTTDIDLLVRKRDSSTWKSVLAIEGYQVLNETDTFQQYERPGDASWPLDLMLVNDATYDGMAAASLPVQVMGASLRMVSVKHLIALKLHVLKQGKLPRFLDDFLDVVELVKSNRLDLQSPEFHDLFLRYGTTDLYEKVRRIASAK